MCSDTQKSLQIMWPSDHLHRFWIGPKRPGVFFEGSDCIDASNCCALVLAVVSVVLVGDQCPRLGTATHGAGDGCGCPGPGFVPELLLPPRCDAGTVKPERFCCEHLSPWKPSDLDSNWGPNFHATREKDSRPMERKGCPSFRQTHVWARHPKFDREVAATLLSEFTMVSGRYLCSNPKKIENSFQDAVDMYRLYRRCFPTDFPGVIFSYLLGIVMDKSCKPTNRANMN